MTAAENTEKTPMDGAPEIDFDRFRPTRSAIQRRNIMDHFMWVLIAVAFVIACIPLISLLWTTIINGVKRLNLNFLSYNMTGVVGGNQTPSGGYGGVLHAIIGTLEITAGAMVISIPIGLMCAVYLVEYSNRGKLATTVVSAPVATGRCDFTYLLFQAFALRLLNLRGDFDRYDDYMAQTKNLFQDLVDIRIKFEPKAEQIAKQFAEEPYTIFIASGALWGENVLFLHVRLGGDAVDSHARRHLGRVLPRHPRARRARRARDHYQGRGRVPRTRQPR